MVGRRKEKPRVVKQRKREYRERIVAFRLTDSEREKLKRVCRERGFVTVSECLRSLLAGL
jgi:DNA-binding MarR family transcriptional regulator